MEFLRDQKPEILDAISNDGAIRDEDELIGAINEFKSLSDSYEADAEEAQDESLAAEEATEEVAEDAAEEVAEE